MSNSSIKNLTVNMTSGDIKNQIINFAVPLLLGTLFQQAYNLVDTWVVGNYVSDEAFAALGVTGPAVKMINQIIIGFSTGISIVVSQYFGTEEKKRIVSAIQTAISFAIILVIIITPLVYFLIPSILRVSAIPEDSYEYAKQYLSIIFLFVAFTIIFNICSAVLRAIGNSKAPFQALCFASITNIILDLVFVLIFHQGVRGIAFATVISQAVSSVITGIELRKLCLDYCVSLRELKFDISIGTTMFKLGVPIAIQGSIVQFSNMIVMSYFSYFGETILSGYAIYSKVDQIFILTIDSISVTITTFVGQNIGAGNNERAKSGTKIALRLMIIIWLVFLILVELFSTQIGGIFTSTKDSIDYGSLMLRMNTPFFCILAVAYVFAGYLQGCGKTKAVTFARIFSNVFVRQIYLFVVTKYIFNSPSLVGLCFPVGWIANGIISYLLTKQVGPKKMKD